MGVSDAMIVARSLRSRLFSTVVTVLTVAVAVGLMVVLLSVRDSGRRTFARGSGNVHLLVSADTSPLVSVLNGVFYANAPARPVPWTEYVRLSRDPRLSAVIPTLLGDSYRGYPVVATTGQFFTHFSTDPEYEPGSGRGAGWALARGRFFEGPGEVVLGARVWRQTGLRIGDRIHLTHGMSGMAGAHEHAEDAFVVVGVLEPTGTAHDRALFIDIRSSWLMHARDRLAREGSEVEGLGVEGLGVEDLTAEDRLVTGILVRGATRSGRSSSAVIPSVAAELRANPRLTVASPADEVGRLFEIVGQIDKVLIAMAGVVLVSSGVGIMLALYNSMEQRRRQIAVLRVLGCSAAGIFRLVVMEAAAIGAAGAVVGVVVGLVGLEAVVGVMKQRVGVVIVPAYSWKILAGVAVGSVALAALAGVAPAVLAYRTSVAKNLRPLG